MQRLAFVFVLHASVVRADETQSAVPPPGIAVAGTVGVATPLGFTGVELDARLARWLSVRGGVGLGASGPQVAVMPRLSVPTSEGTWDLGVGLSAGPYTWFYFPPDESNKVWNLAYWANFEVGVGRHFHSGPWNWHAFIGFSQILNKRDFHCSDTTTDCMDGDSGERIPYVGFSFGRTVY